MAIKIQYDGDPSNVLQQFPKNNLQVLCCRHWWLQQWEFRELSFPYWRIYHNQNSGAVIIHNEQQIPLDPGRIMMIAPNTSYSSRLFDNPIPEHGYAFTGNRITKSVSEEALIRKNLIMHLFIHFTVGLPYDNASSGIFQFDLTDRLGEKLQVIREHLRHDYQNFTVSVGLTIQSLIFDLLAQLSEGSWNIRSFDSRIRDVLELIHSDLSADLSNPVLADRARMAINSFTRVFRQETGLPPQKYVQKKRVDQASILLHHSNLSIDEIASRTGFYDRFQFTKMFRKWTGIPPAAYRKDYSISN